MPEEKVYTRQPNRIGDHCKHFDGINFVNPDKACKAGVLMTSVIVHAEYSYRYEGRQTVYTAKHCFPCFRNGDPVGVTSCMSREFPTQEEIDAENAEIDRTMANITTVRKAIMAQVGPKAKGVQATLACPICKAGTVVFAVHSNGHVHARCSTEDCVSWLE